MSLSPFLGECLTESEIIEIKKLKPQLDELPTTLDHCNSAKLKYRGRVYRMRCALHLGQAKLGIGLIKLLTRFGDSANTVLYVGAAPGTNIGFVSELFPNHRFELYDPVAFKLKDNSRINVHREYFTTQIAKEYATRGEKVIFVSDIRTTSNEFENEVEKNMADQLQWWKILEDSGIGSVAMFKFRLPYESKKVEYPEGEIWFQAFAAPTSTETRLIVKPGAKTQLYDSGVYEEEMFWHNNIRREWGWWGIPNELHIRGYDGCYDCTLMVDIFGEYIENTGKKLSINEMCKQLSILVENHFEHINQSLISPPHGMKVGLPMFQRRQSLYEYQRNNNQRHQHRVQLRRGSQRSRR